jgi:hypothetical protein
VFRIISTVHKTGRPNKRALPVRDCSYESIYRLVLISNESRGLVAGAIAGKRRIWYQGSCSTVNVAVVVFFHHVHGILHLQTPPSRNIWASFTDFWFCLMLRIILPTPRPLAVCESFVNIPHDVSCSESFMHRCKLFLFCSHCSCDFAAVIFKSIWYVPMFFFLFTY